MSNLAAHKRTIGDKVLYRALGTVEQRARLLVSEQQRRIGHPLGFVEFCHCVRVLLRLARLCLLGGERVTAAATQIRIASGAVNDSE